MNGDEMSDLEDPRRFEPTAPRNACAFGERERERIVEFSILVSEEDKENEKWVFFFFFFGCFLNEVAGSLVIDSASGQTLRWVLRSVWLTHVGVCICFVLRFFFFSLAPVALFMRHEHCNQVNAQ